VPIGIRKLLFLDIGLMNAICGLGWGNVSQMTDAGLINEGAREKKCWM